MRGEGGSRFTSKLKQRAHIHQPTAWPLLHSCAQPYHAGSGSHGQLFCPYWGSSAWHSRRSVTGENPCCFVFWRSKGRCAMPQGYENKGNKTIRQKEKQKQKTRVTYRIKRPPKLEGAPPYGASPLTSPGNRTPPPDYLEYYFNTIQYKRLHTKDKKERTHILEQHSLKPISR